MEETLKQCIMRRDGLSEDEADSMIEGARQDVREGADPEEVLLDWFGLEPDFVFDLLGGV